MLGLADRSKTRSPTPRSVPSADHGKSEHNSPKPDKARTRTPGPAPSDAHVTPDHVQYDAAVFHPSACTHADPLQVSKICIKELRTVLLSETLGSVAATESGGDDAEDRAAVIGDRSIAARRMEIAAVVVLALPNDSIFLGGRCTANDIVS
jgi:hypothetical protein